MNAESLVDDALGFIREMTEQNAENPRDAPGRSKKRDMLNAWVPRLLYIERMERSPFTKVSI